ncbi:hypothetical protein JTB14_010695 [Gonioctena quinquepunctata]|nr:hypothetical protein JTB14_010695 [Gonioctena quinquepunctata]
MSKQVEEKKILTHSEVNRKIIAKVPSSRPEEDLLGPFNEYNDENYKKYNEKKKQFYEACRKYNRMNQETLVCHRRRLHEDYMENLECGFLIDDEDNKDRFLRVTHDPKGRQIRRRTERSIHHVPDVNQMVCSLEPWFKRYLILNKFIWAARTILIRNRLLKVLRKLKELDEEAIKKFEKPIIFEGSYGTLFRKFLLE